MPVIAADGPGDMQPLWKAYEREFPVRRHCVFLDHAATAPIPARTAAAVTRLAEEMTRFGGSRWRQWYAGFEGAHARAAELVECHPDDVALVKNTTHGLLIAAGAIDFQPGDNVVLPAREFPANVYPWLQLERDGIEVRMVQPSGRHVSADDLIAACDRRTRAIAVSWVQFTDGYRIDLASLSDFTRRRGIYLVVDAIQGLGAIPLSLRRVEVDFLCADGHKWLLSPEGCGVLYVRRDIIDRLRPVNIGWHSMSRAEEFLRYQWRPRPSARRFEEGSPNMLGAHALAASVGLLLEVGVSRVWQAICELTDRLAEGLLGRGAELLTPLDHAHRSGIVSFRLPATQPEHLVRWLRQRGIFVACRGGAVRVSPHFYNAPDDVDAFLAALDDFADAEQR